MASKESWQTYYGSMYGFVREVANGRIMPANVKQAAELVIGNEVKFSEIGLQPQWLDLYTNDAVAYDRSGAARIVRDGVTSAILNYEVEPTYDEKGVKISEGFLGIDSNGLEIRSLGQRQAIEFKTDCFDEASNDPVLSYLFREEKVMGELLENLQKRAGSRSLQWTLGYTFDYPGDATCCSMQPVRLQIMGGSSLLSGASEERDGSRYHGLSVVRRL